MSLHASHIAKLVILVFLFLFTGSYLFSRQQITQQDYHEIYRIAVSGKKAAFVEAALNTEIDGPIDTTALAELCRTKTWTPGLIFNCRAPQGGIGNVRNVILNCVRYAIEAGATAFVVPEIMSRGTTLETLHEDINVPFTYYFDVDHFTTYIARSCPQIEIISHVNDLWDKPSTANAPLLATQELSDEFVADTVLAHPGNWSGAFKQYLNTTHPKPFSTSLPILITLHTPLLQFPLSYDEPLLVANFGKMLRFREDVRRLAATILYAMDKKFRMEIDADMPGIYASKFYGAQLRTAADAKAAGWTPYTHQVENYLRHAQQHKLPAIYLMAGDEADAKRFTDAAANLSIEAVTREQLLTAKGFEREMKEMKSLTWDQRGLIDYEVLLRSSLFGGTHESSFAWNLAMKRHVVVGGGKWLRISRNSSKPMSRKRQQVQEAKVGPAEEKEVPRQSGDHKGPQSFKDSLSIVFGPPDEGEMFKLSMWP